MVKAIVGAGPVDLAAIMAAKLYPPGQIISIDLAESRLAKAREFGADVTIDNGFDDAVQRALSLTDGLGADVAIEAVGLPATFELCTELVRPGGGSPMSAFTATPSRSTWRRSGSAA